MAWHRIAGELRPREGQMVQVEVAGRAIVLARQESKLRAFNARCPHASALLVEGDLRPGYVICPLHAYRYDLETGRCLKPRDGPRLRLYEVEERGGELWIELPAAPPERDGER